MSKFFSSFVLLVSLLSLGLQNANAQHHIDEIYEVIDSVDKGKNLVSIKRVRGNIYKILSNAERSKVVGRKVVSTFKVRGGWIEDGDFARVISKYIAYHEKIEGPVEKENISVADFEGNIKEQLGKNESLKFIVDEDGDEKTLTVLDEKANPFLTGLPLDKDGNLPGKTANILETVLIERYGPPEHQAPPRPGRVVDPDTDPDTDKEEGK